MSDNGLEENEDDYRKVHGFMQVLADELVRMKSERGLCSDYDAFTDWALELINPAYSQTKGSPDKFADVQVSDAKGQNIDAAWFDKGEQIRPKANRGVYYVAHVKCPEHLGEVARYKSDAATELESAVSWLEDQDEGARGWKKSGVKYQYYDYCSPQVHNFSCRAILVIAGIPEDDSLAERIRGIKAMYPRVHAEVYDMVRLRALYIRSLQDVEDKPPPEVEFKILAENHYRKKEGFAKALIAEVPLVEIRRLYSEFGLSLFKKNLRGPLVDSPFNAGMKKTIEDGEERDKFWYYNNGLTATCDGYEFKDDEDSDAARTVLVQNLQIVNGCQTCTTVNFSSLDWESKQFTSITANAPSVSLRLIDNGSVKEKDKLFDRKIARFTNSQTAVTDRDLHANDEEQILSKKDFSRFWYFLEVKTDEWKQMKRMGLREIRDTYVKPFCFDNEDVAQAFIAFWQHRPAHAKTDKNDIWTDDTLYRSIFDVRGPALVVPVQVRHLYNLWSKEMGFKKKFKRDTPKSRRMRFPAEVARNGELYVVAMLGASIMNLWEAGSPSDMSKDGLNRLMNCCNNLRRLILKYGNESEIPKMRQEFDKSLKKAHRILTIYSRSECRKHGFASSRNLLVLDSTWDDLMKQKEEEIRKISVQLLPLLEMHPDKA